ncbi:hypothetical protein [Solwaraspora sp. WMMA2065]|uniref:hypothetical protein n=1 Tax=Solwaraspora sp. WMMA2065 TaxID=3015166 RepID=UPI00259B4B74|nr:hypothetical protein [Solwaraspora sp. WMMA2065]WJK33138.1 hypothetical protein O7610_20805 [Solwaraspora sp. WMMA2065]
MVHVPGDADPFGAHVPHSSRPTSAGMTVVDRTFGEHGQGYEVTEIRRTGGGLLLRVRIHRDAYPQQSHALVEVFTPAMTWTRLTHEPVSAWHDTTPSSSSSAMPLTDLAERLFRRAAAILG